MTTPPRPAWSPDRSVAARPRQVWALLNALVEGSPFAAWLTRAETAAGTLAFPTVGPTASPGWSSSRRSRS